MWLSRGNETIAKLSCESKLFKETVQLETTFWSSFTHPHVIPNL